MSSLALLEQRLAEQPWCRRVDSVTDDYTLVPCGDDAGLLGRGTFAAVRRYQHCGTGRCVAVKELAKRSLVDNMTKVRQLLVEVAVTKTLQHAAIAQTHEVLLTEEHVYLIMSLCRGLNLQEHLVQAGGKLPQADAAVIFGQLLSAIACLHVNCLVHRDVKPANIIVDPATLETKLIDFGLGKHVGKRKPTFAAGHGVLYGADAPLDRQISGRSISSEDDTVLATPEAGSVLYLAVEALTGKLESDDLDSDGWTCLRRDIYKLDVYAAGATAFKMITGRLPYESARGSFSIAQQRRIMSMHPARLPHDAGIDDDGRMLLEAMLNKQPQQRPAAADALYSPWLVRYRKACEDRVGAESPSPEAQSLSLVGSSSLGTVDTDAGRSWAAMMAVVEEDDRTSALGVEDGRREALECDRLHSAAAFVGSASSASIL